MARINVKLPKLGETVDLVVIIEWLVSVGDVVAVGDDLVRVETDKVDAELPSPVAGTVSGCFVVPGDEVSTGDRICVIETQ